MNQNCMITREAALEFCLSFQNTYTERPFRDQNWQVVRAPFQNGNGRVGRLIMFKECLKYNIVPFIIEDNSKLFYYRGLKEWDNEKGYLTDTCLTAQDKYKEYLDYFRIAY